MKKVICVVGTRPEAIKMAPVIRALKNCDWADCSVLATAQHRQMLDQVLSLFEIVPDFDLDVMKPNQSLAELSASLMAGVDKLLEEMNPDVVLVQGDTTTVMITSIACFYRSIPVGHVEAGLRTNDLHNPFPEEFNRVVTGVVARWHFAPTASARESLLKERIPDGAIYMTGNTVIDALLDVAARPDGRDCSSNSDVRDILVTLHRRENFGEPMRQVCEEIRDLASERDDVRFVFPVHLNPRVREVVYEVLGGIERVELIEPLDYLPFVQAMKASYIILSDSGGVQEEAPALSKPVLVLRDETERPEAIACGVAKLVGCDRDKIRVEVAQLLDDPEYYASMAAGASPYGDGRASERIVKALERDLIGTRVD